MKRSNFQLSFWLSGLAALALWHIPAPVVGQAAPASPPGVNPPVPPAPDAPPAPPKIKMAPPNEAARAPVMKLLREVFEKEYADKTPAGKRVLAQRLLAEAEKNADNFPTRYVMLQEALDSAAAGGDADICRQSLDQINQFYTANIDEMTCETAVKLQTSVSDDVFAAWGMEAAQRMIEQEGYQAARRMVRIVAPRIAKSKDPAQHASLKAIESTLAEYEKVRPSIDKLIADPADPAANLVAGKFYCFFKHDYARGLPLLGRGNDVALKEIALKDRATPADAAARFQLAGYWWDLSNDKTHANLQGEARARANFWYALALPELDGLKKVMAEKRVAQAPPATAGGTPAVSRNMIASMKLEGQGTTVEGGAIQMARGGKLKTPEEVTVPFRAEFTAKTDSTNIRLGFNRGLVILNWEGNPSELRHHDPATGRITAIRGAGTIPVNEYIQVTWVVLPDASKVYVNGQERASIRGKYTGLHGFVSIFPAGSTVTVKSVNITTGASVR